MIRDFRGRIRYLEGTYTYRNHVTKGATLPDQPSRDSYEVNRRRAQATQDAADSANIGQCRQLALHLAFI